MTGCKKSTLERRSLSDVKTGRGSVISEKPTAPTNWEAISEE